MRTNTCPEFNEKPIWFFIIIALICFSWTMGSIESGDVTLPIICTVIAIIFTIITVHNQKQGVKDFLQAVLDSPHTKSYHGKKGYKMYVAQLNCTLPIDHYCDAYLKIADDDKSIDVYTMTDLYIGNILPWEDGKLLMKCLREGQKLEGYVVIKNGFEKQYYSEGCIGNGNWFKIQLPKID